LVVILVRCATFDLSESPLQCIEHLIGGLRDESPDIKTVCHIMVEHLAEATVSASLVLALDQLVEPLKNTLTNKPKENAVKQEKERYEELVRSALRAIAAVNRLQGVETSSRFSEFVKNVCLAGDIGEKYRRAISSTATLSDPMDTS
jgi:cullin-associated NEDD8-dissociated protein 1